jgi:drug/metabolite transporter (DMT)-like permease
MVGAPLALGSSVSGGTSDFLGGTNSRRIGTMQWMFCTQIAGLVFACGWLALSGGPMPEATAVLAAAGAGLSLTFGLAAFFQAMVVGTISIVAPISATGVVIPIVAGLAGGERPSAVQVIGIVAAVTGIVFVCRQPRRGRSSQAHGGIALALLAALGSGLFFWLMAPASHNGVPWAVVISRSVAVIALAVIIAIRRESIRPALDLRTARIAPVAALLGFGGIALYAESTLYGGLAIMSVLGNLYPAMTVMLAYFVLGERVYGIQRVGIAAVFAGVVMMSA